MTTITEDRLAFDFPVGWLVQKYDKSTFYLRHFQNVCGAAKGVDIVAISPAGCLWFIEIKDYRAGPRQKSLDLVEEIAIKARDSLAGLAAARVRANVESEATFAARAMQFTDIKIILHIEQPTKPTRLHPVVDVSKLLLKLKQLRGPSTSIPGSPT